MNQFDWKRATRIFEAALALPPEARNQFVQCECAADKELETEVLNLLSGDERAKTFLENPAVPMLYEKSTDVSLCLFSPGDVLSGRFQIRRFIGQGGMGQVYEALDSELRERIAIKAIHPDISSDSRTMSRFVREVQITRRITHPNVCRTFDIGRDKRLFNGVEEQITFLTMEFLEGETLADVLRHKGRFTTNEAMPLVLQLLRALSAAHKIGIIHRDFKPSNILLVRADTSIRAVVTDFGLARTFTPQSDIPGEQTSRLITSREGLVGTLVYMAPEQLERGLATPASDIYALGLVIYEMITGRRPFFHTTPFAEAVIRLNQDPPSPRAFCENLDPRWEFVIAHCLECEPKSRFSSIDEIEVALTGPNRTSATGAQVPTATTLLTSTRISPPQKLIRSVRAHLVKFSVVLLLSVALILGCLRLMKWGLRSSTIGEGSSILLTDISNQSHDPEMNGIGELLRNQLSQSAYMNILEPTRIQETLQRMSRPIDSPLEPRIAREVAWRQGVPVVIFGTLSRIADDYKLDLKMDRVGNDPSHARASWSFSETSQSKRDLLQAVYHGGLWVRRMIGETEVQIQTTDRKPEDVTTSSWEALNFYSEGQRLAATDKLEEATLLFKEAAEKDPEFAMAWMRRGDTLDNLGRIDEGFASWQKAISISGNRRLSQREELRIKGMFSNDTGDLKSAIDYFGQYVIAYPNDYLGYFFRAYPLMLTGRTEEAIQVLKEAEKRVSDSYYVADHLARYNLIVGRFDEVARYTDRLRQLGRDGYADQIDGQTDVVKGDFEAAHNFFSRLYHSGDPYLQSVSSYLDASAFAERGRYDEAINALRNGIETDLKLGDSAGAADKWIALAYLYSKRAEPRASRDAGLRVLTLSRDARRIAEAGTVLARNGFIADAQNLITQVPKDQHYPIAQVAALRLQGEVLLARGHCHGAFQEFEKARALDQESSLLHDYWFHALIACGRLPEALEDVDRLRSRVGQVWHHPENYMPGWDADLLFQAARLRHQLKDPDAKAQLSKYLSLRDGSTIPEVSEARRMYSQ